MRYYTNEQNQSCDESFCLMFIFYKFLCIFQFIEVIGKLTISCCIEVSEVLFLFPFTVAMFSNVI
jgi:hypothetical protein